VFMVSTSVAIFISFTSRLPSSSLLTSVHFIQFCFDWKCSEKVWCKTNNWTRLWDLTSYFLENIFKIWWPILKLTALLTTQIAAKRTMILNILKYLY
jgi:hypothetical protein